MGNTEKSLQYYKLYVFVNKRGG